MRDAPLARAIEIIGGAKKVADLFGIKSQAVSQWDRCPADRCLVIEAASGVSVYELRPDIYGKKPSRKRAA